MTEKPNCSNCPHRKPAKEGYYQKMNHCEILGLHFEYPITCSENPMWILQEVGCLSHPQAQEYLMAPVIAELERKRDRRAEFIYESSTNPMVAAYDEAINLIKGVK